ncbi:trigger factor [Alphaproteobacteria bacterium]|jgi:trigger factor|nr:trigger factor [Alphaproteobacteria bacterium]
MNYKNIEKKEYKSSFEVSLDQDSITKIIDEKINEKQPTFEIAGFRKGKVPINIIKSKIGPQIENEVLNDEISKNISEISEKEKIESLIQPDVQFKDSYNFSLSFFLKPEIKLEELKSSEIEKISAEVTKKDIDDFREKVRKEYYSLESIDVADDNSVVDFEVINFGDEQKKIFSQKEVRIDFNTNTEEETFKDLKKALSKIKNKSDFNMTTKSTQIEGKIKDIHKKIFPDSDDELIKILKLNTVDELNTKISDKLNEDVNYLQKEFFIEDLLKVLSNKKKIEVNSEVVDLELKRKYQIDLATMKDEHKERIDSLKKLTSENIQKDFIFSELVKFLDAKVDQKELQEHIQKYYGEKIDQRTAETAYGTLLRNKIADQSMKTFKIKETKLSLDEMMKKGSHNHESGTHSH